MIIKEIEYRVKFVAERPEGNRKRLEKGKGNHYSRNDLLDPLDATRASFFITNTDSVCENI
jgi:hypothetical protein